MEHGDLLLKSNVCIMLVLLWNYAF